jgi:hypothetical protein
MYLPHQHSIELLKCFLEATVAGARVTGNQDHSAIEVEKGGQRISLPLGQAELDDLEEALTNERLPISYKNGQKADAMLGALVAVGRAGMAADVELLKVMVIDVSRDWNLSVVIRGASFPAETARKIYEAVTSLNAMAARQLAEAGVPVESLEKEMEVLSAIKSQYETRGNLNDTELSGRTLSYIKAAVGCWLLNLERQKANATAPRVKEALSKWIFEIFGQYWTASPYNRIPLPHIFRDYLADQKTALKADQIGPSIDIGPLLLRVDQRLESRWRGAWDALRSENPDKVSQAANSMVEVVDKVIGSVCGEKQFTNVLAELYPEQQEVIEATRKYIAALKNTLQSVKHETNAQQVHTAEDLMHAAEGIIRTLLR